MTDRLLPPRRCGFAALLLAGVALAGPAAAQSSFLGLGYLSPAGAPGLSTCTVLVK